MHHMSVYVQAKSWITAVNHQSDSVWLPPTSTVEKKKWQQPTRSRHSFNKSGFFHYRSQTSAAFCLCAVPSWGAAWPAGRSPLCVRLVSLAVGLRAENITKDFISFSDNNHISVPPRSHGGLENPRSCTVLVSSGVINTFSHHKSNLLAQIILFPQAFVCLSGKQETKSSVGPRL